MSANQLPVYRAWTHLGENLKYKYGLDRCPLVNSAAAVHAVFGHIASFRKEVMIAGALDIKSRLLCWSIISVGSCDSLLVRPGDAFVDTIRTGASGIILVHNHPSGSLEPSKEDFALTRRVKRAGNLIGYPLFDHVIISSQGYKSLLSAALTSKSVANRIGQLERAADHHT